MLQRIEISGFKSFAKKAELRFGSRVVGVVGPNGSGKSNVAESFRFVLGEQSMKAMRSGKGEDLIWNGSIGMAKSNKASVALTFDNRHKLFAALDVPEVTLERAVYRDGQNEYSINGKQVRLKDVTELLASISIGTSKHHIISQGQADRMLNSSPLERREMLLDALGLTAVDLKKNEAARNLTKTESHMKEVEAARREARPRLLFLEKQIEKYTKAEKVRSELAHKARAFIQHERGVIERESTRAVGESREPRAKLAEATAKRDTARANLAHSKDTRALATFEEEKRAAHARERALEDRLSACIRERAKVAARLEVLAEQAAPVQTHNATSRESLSIPQNALKALKTAQEGVSNAVRLSGDYQAAFNALTTALVQFWAHMPRTTTETSTTSTRPIITLDTSSLREQETKLEEEEETLHSELHTTREAVRTAETGITNQRLTTSESEREILELSAHITELTLRVQTLDHAANDLKERKQRVTTLEEECSTLLGALFTQAHATESTHTDTTLVDIERLKIRVEELGTPDADVTKEHTEAKERDDFLAKELLDVMSAKEALTSMIAKLESEMDATFTNGLRIVNTSFEEFFKSLFGGGEAKLVETRDERRRIKDVGFKTAEKSDTAAHQNTVDQSAVLQDEEEKMKQGIDIEVHLPKKKVHSLGMLSGGERALTSIALICAFSQVNPPPFIILDETDAALDEANSSRFAAMIRTLSHKSQCVVITHNRATMAAAGELYGITMGSDGVSRLLSVKLEEAERVAK